MKLVAFLAAFAAITLAVGTGGDGPPGRSAPPTRDSLAEMLRPIPCDDLPSREILDALEKPVDLDYDKIPLSKFVEELRPRLGGNFMLDEQGLQNAMVAPDLPVTFHCRGIRLRCALEAALRPHGLTISFENEIIYLTDWESQQKRNVARVYPLPDFWSDPWAGDEKTLSHLLIHCITDTVERDVWEANGGDATIRFYPPTLSLVVNCPHRTHTQVQILLNGLRRARVQRDALFQTTKTPPSRERIRKLTASFWEDFQREQASKPPSAAPQGAWIGGEAEKTKGEAGTKAPPPAPTTPPKSGNKPAEAK